MKLIILPVFLFSMICMGASERIFYSGARNIQTVELAEDFYQIIQYDERIPVTRTVCSDVPVTQNYCEWVAGQRICQTQPICHATPYGPRCIPTFGCYDTPPRQYCRPVTTVQRQCGERTVYENVTRTERRFLYKSNAEIELVFDELPREFAFIEFDVNLINDQISFSTESTFDPVIVSKLIESNDSGRGQFKRRYQISTIHLQEYYSPISQIPELIQHNWERFEIEIGKVKDIGDIQIEITIRHLRTGQYYRLPIFSPIIRQQDDRSMLIISLSREMGRNWPYWINNFRELEIILTRKVDGQVINSENYPSNSVRNKFYF